MKCVYTGSVEFKKLEQKFDSFPLKLVIMEYQEKYNTDEYPSEDYIKELIGYSEEHIKRSSQGLDDTTSLELAKTLSERFKVPYEVVSESEVKKRYPDLEKDVNSLWDGEQNKVVLISGKIGRAHV